MVSKKRSIAAKKAWRTRKRRYGKTGVRKTRYRINRGVLSAIRRRRRQHY